MDSNEDKSPYFEKLRDTRSRYLKQPLFPYLNINSLRNKVIDLKEILGYLSPDYLVLFKTNLDDSFPLAQFSLPNYEIQARRDRDKNGGDLIEFVKKGLISKRLKNFEPRKSECICSKITVSMNKWLCVSIYRPPSHDNLELFFDKFTSSLSKARENFIVMGGFNVAVANKGVEFDKVDESCDLFNLTNLVTSPTCFTKTHKSAIDLILTNTRNCFQNTKLTETGLSHFHKLISTFLQSHFSRLNSKTIYYRNYKKFNQQKFLQDFKNTNFCFNPDDPNNNYELTKDLFSKIVNKHAPLKKKF